ncbi:CD5 antigen-like [Micropterus salmoides]|uniref:CD5 antigen-like n=1 Tax=Micropterus salmoides TaxID=27706 RepID=UPI0018EDB3D5|nr:CD5 antigen-like [Micropterus salmoides]
MIRAESRQTARETVYLDMDHLLLLLLLLLLWSSGLQAEGRHTSTEPDDVRLVGGASRCAGTLEVKHQGDWRPGSDSVWTLKAAAVVCRDLDCGSAVSVGQRKKFVFRPVWGISFVCVQSGSALRDCVSSSSSSSILDLTCSGTFLQWLAGIHVVLSATFTAVYVVRSTFPPLRLPVLFF